MDKNSVFFEENTLSTYTF